MQDIAADDLLKLRMLIRPSLDKCLPYSDEAIEMFNEVLCSYQSFFQPEHLEAVSLFLRSQWGQERLSESLRCGSSTDQFIRLLVTFAERDIDEIVRDPKNPSNVEIMCTSFYFLINKYF